MQAKKILLFSLLIILLKTQVMGQSCTHSELSNTFIYKTTIKRIEKEKHADSCIISVSVMNKIEKNTVFKCRIFSNFLLGDSSFVQCCNARSYITGYNRYYMVMDNDFGDIIIADFNFDEKEDFAVKREEGGNGGPIYNYYLQTNDTTFLLDKYLSYNMEWFPTEINKENRTLVTLVHANAYEMCEKTFYLNTQTNKWSLIRKRFLK